METKIAVASEDGNYISAHFGRTPYFVVFTIDGDRIVNRELRDNRFTPHMQNNRNGAHHAEEHESHHQEGHRCGSSAVDGLSDCQAVICGGAGKRIVDHLNSAGIEMVLTRYSSVMETIDAFMNGELTSSVEPCSGHSH